MLLLHVMSRSFGSAAGSAVIKNLGVINEYINGLDYVGGIVGVLAGTASITNSYTSGVIGGNTTIEAGGLVGQENSTLATGAVNNSFSSATIIGFQSGGIAGSGNGTASGTHTIFNNDYSSGSVTSLEPESNTYGGGDPGGLIGYTYWATINTSYAAASVTGNFNIGGLVGYGYGTNIANSYAVGKVTGGPTGYDVAGFMGWEDATSTITTSYSSGAVSGGTTKIAGFIGYQSPGATVTTSYWDSGSSGQATGIAAANGTGTPTSGTFSTLNQLSTFTAAWGSANITSTPGAGYTWFIINGVTRPLLYFELSGQTISANPLVTNTFISSAHSLQLIGVASTTLAGNYTLLTDINAVGTSTASNVWNGAGFVPLGTSGTQFTGSLTGGHAIYNLYIHSALTANIGLIGYAGTSANVSDIGVGLGSSITGTAASVNGIGGLFGTNAGTASNVYSLASVTDTAASVTNIGGLAGVNSGTISNAYSTGTVTVGATPGFVGGFVGNNSGTITNSYVNSATSGQAATLGTGTGGVTAETTNAMQTQSTYSGWDFLALGKLCQVILILSSSILV